MAEHAAGAVRKRQLGMTPIRPSRPLYGTELRCLCGARFTSNSAPSNGGRKAVEALHRDHAAYWAYVAECEAENLEAHPRQMWETMGRPKGPLG